MSEDDADDDGDWFEQALQDEERGPEEPGVDAAETDPDVTEERDVAAGADKADEADEPDETPADPSRVTDEADEEPSVGADEADEDPAGAADEADQWSAGVWSDEDTGTGSPFEEDAESAFGGGSTAGGDGEGGGADWTSDVDRTASPFVDEAGEAAAESGGGMFDDDFASAFGGGGDGGGGEGDFDEPYKSEIPRIDLGITGLDEMIQGGIPERHLLTCIGGPGSGKTTFGLQFLDHGIRNGQHGVFITLEQSHESILDTAEEHGWPFDEYEDEDSLAIVDLDPVEMANSLDNIRGELPDLIEQFGADRLVMDSVSLLEMMYDDQARRRTEVFDFTRSLKKAGVTTFLTSEADHDNPYTSRHGIIEYLTDAVFVLQYVRGETQETRLAVEIQKIRNANHSREMKPYEITSGGISVYQQANIF